MADCDEDEVRKGDDGASCCDGNGGKNLLLYACSGGANVAEIADRIARELMFEGRGAMFCLAGLGAGIDGMIQTAGDADLNVVIDGCDMDCARKIFDNCGLENYIQVKVTDYGIEKVKGARATDDQIAVVMAAVRGTIAKA